MLEGARIRKARWNPGGRTFELVLRDGTEEVLLRYRGVAALEPELPRLAALIEDVSLVVLDAGEVAGVAWIRLGAPANPAGAAEISIRHDSVERSSGPAPGAEYGDSGVRFEILSC